MIIKYLLLIGIIFLICEAILLLIYHYELLRYGFFFNILIVSNIIVIFYYQINFLKNLKLVDDKYFLQSKKTRYNFIFRLSSFLLQFFLSHISLYLVIFSDFFGYGLIPVPTTLMIMADFNFKKLMYVKISDKFM